MNNFNSSIVEPWGWELILDCRGGNDNIRHAPSIASFCKELVRVLDMEAYGEPQIVKFGKDNKSGYTLVQLITTSNITAHFCDETGDFYLNIFSCKPYDSMRAIHKVQEWFEPWSISRKFLSRGAPTVEKMPSTPVLLDRYDYSSSPSR